MNGIETATPIWRHLFRAARMHRKHLGRTREISERPRPTSCGHPGTDLKICGSLWRDLGASRGIRGRIWRYFGASGRHPEASGSMSASNERPQGPQSGQRAPKGSAKESKVRPKEPKSGPRGDHRTPKAAKGRPQGAPKGPRDIPGAQKQSQGCPKGAPERPK